MGSILDEGSPLHAWRNLWTSLYWKRCSLMVAFALQEPLMKSAPLDFNVVLARSFVAQYQTFFAAAPYSSTTRKTASSSIRHRPVTGALFRNYFCTRILSVKIRFTKKRQFDIPWLSRPTIHSFPKCNGCINPLAWKANVRTNWNGSFAEHIARVASQTVRCPMNLYCTFSNPIFCLCNCFWKLP